MKALKGSAAAKILAALLIVFLVGAMVASVLGIVVLEELGAYSSGLEPIRKEALNAICNDRSYDAMRRYAIHSEDPDYIFPDSGFCFIVRDSEGNVLYDNLNGRETIAASQTVIVTRGTGMYDDNAYYLRMDDGSEEIMDTESPREIAPNAVSPEVSGTASTALETPLPTATAKPGAATETADGKKADAESADADTDTAKDKYKDKDSYYLNGYILQDYPAGSNESLTVDAVTLAYNMRYSFFVIAIVSFVAVVMLFVFLMGAAGHRAGTDEISERFIDKIPFDLFTAVVVLIECCIAALCVELTYAGDHWIALLMLCCVCCGAFLLVGLLWCMGWAVRIKLHKTIRGCICYKILAWIWRCIKRLWSAIIGLLHSLPLIKGAAVIIAGILVVEFLYICAAGGSIGGMLFGWFIERLVLVALTIYVLLCMKKLLKAGKEISQGNMSYAVDTAKMYGPLKEHGEDLNNITLGMNKAVGERMKSERFRTELITNVSHDIKTPLTSIINYVDLMEKEEPENPRMKEYLEVLSRQSERLKKLIDDLLEASKASTGNLTVSLQPCELGVLMDQCAGEYVEKLQNAQLELVVNKPEKTVVIMADGRHLWRIFDNLLNNVCKYAQRGTRVYLSLEQSGDKAIVTMKNISASMLNVSGDELMERFVRGDSSRSTEGSGLGLNIAKSLAELQKGDLNIAVDGDLFKVTLSFDIVKE